MTCILLEHKLSNSPGPPFLDFPAFNLFCYQLPVSSSLSATSVSELVGIKRTACICICECALSSSLTLSLSSCNYKHVSTHLPISKHTRSLILRGGPPPCIARRAADVYCSSVCFCLSSPRLICPSLYFSLLVFLPHSSSPHLQSLPTLTLQFHLVSSPPPSPPPIFPHFDYFLHVSLIFLSFLPSPSSLSLSLSLLSRLLPS